VPLPFGGFKTCLTPLPLPHSPLDLKQKSTKGKKKRTNDGGREQRIAATVTSCPQSEPPLFYPKSDSKKPSNTATTHGGCCVGLLQRTTVQEQPTACHTHREEGRNKQTKIRGMLSEKI
jgi:hypothetical protein